MRRTAFRILLTGFVVCASMNTHAIMVAASTAERIGFRDCTVIGTSGCDEVGSPALLAYGGLPGDASSSVASTLPGYGSATANVALSGNVGAPVLGSYVDSQPGKRNNTSSYALQSYTYTGAVPELRTFGGVLTYSQSITGSYPSGPGAGIFARIEVFQISANGIDVGDTAESNWFSLFGVSTLPGYTLLGLDSYVDSASTSAGLGNLSVTVDLQPGSTYWINVSLSAIATNGGWVNSSSTLVTEWNDATGLVPGGVAVVPENETSLLLLSGLLILSGIHGLRLRKRRLPIGLC